MSGRREPMPPAEHRRLVMQATMLGVGGVLLVLSYAATEGTVLWLLLILASGAFCVGGAVSVWRDILTGAKDES